MKLTNVIIKNIRLLLRSKTSALVLILGPLMVIVLVGLSFSTTAFNLRISAYSERYSELSNTLMDKLRVEKFTVDQATAKELCIDSVKEGISHACVIFPPDMVIDNQKTNLVSLYVDQSKINIAYLVTSTLKGSIGEKSTEISKGLTDTIVTTILKNKDALTGLQPLFDASKAANIEMLKQNEEIQKSLTGINLNADNKVNADIGVEMIRGQVKEIVTDAISLSNEGIALTNDLMKYKDEVNDSTKYQADLTKVLTSLSQINSTLLVDQNTTLVKINSFASEVSKSVSDLTSKLENAQSVNKQVIDKLKIIKTKSDELKGKIDEIESKTKGVVTSISSIQITNTASIVSPITTEINEVAKSESNFSYLFPSLIVMFIMFLGLLLPSTLIIMEKNSKASFRIFTTPTKNRLYVAAAYLTSMMLMTFQVFIILGISYFYFKISFTMNSLMIAGLSLYMIMTFFIILGMLIGYIFNTEEMAMLAVVCLGTLFLLTSGIIFPLESMPEYISSIASYNPVVLGSEAFKRSLLFSADFSAVKDGLMYLGLFTIAILLVILIIKKSDKFILFVLRPGKDKARRDFLRGQFDFGKRKAKTLSEFIISVENMTDERFRALAEKDAFSEWLEVVIKNIALSRMVQAAKTKEEMVTLLVEELKKGK
jgi:ABC-2 type transport system permease protein